MNICALGKTARRIYKALETGGRKPNVLRGLAPYGRAGNADYERAIGQLFLRGIVRWNGKTTARVLERKP